MGLLRDSSLKKELITGFDSKLRHVKEGQLFHG